MLLLGALVQMGGTGGVLVTRINQEILSTTVTKAAHGRFARPLKAPFFQLLSETSGVWSLGPREQVGLAHHEGSLLLRCLEASMAKLGSGVDELEFDILQSSAAVVH